ncbi:MAG: tyrosine--tRNA ligase, partial [Anaerolineae bacterium]|nr:tyrosine--tRNA ligase [Anaerolineae bacterium]
GMVSSNSEARRLIQQGGVKLDGETVSDLRLELEPAAEPRVLQVGKRKFARLAS